MESVKSIHVGSGRGIYIVHCGMRVMSTALALLLMSPGCKSESSSSKSESAESEEDPKTTEEGALDKGTAMGKRLLSVGKEKTKDLASAGAEVTNTAYEGARKWGTASVDEVYSEARAIVGDAGDIEVAVTTVNTLLGGLAQDPNSEVSTQDRIARMMVLMVPIVGPAKRYIDARMLFAVGVSENNAQRKQEARRELLIAFVEGGLDIGMLGVAGSRIDLVATGADKVLKLLKLTRVVSTLGGSELSTFDELLDALLRESQIRASADAVLTVELSAISP